MAGRVAVVTRTHPDDLWLAVGRLTKPHGLQGAFQYKSFSGDLDATCPGQTVRLQRRDGSALDVVLHAIRPFKQGAIVDLRTETPLERESLRGATLLVQRADLQDLVEGEVLVTDLIGLEAVLPNGQSAGTVRDAMDAGPSVVLVIDGTHPGTVLYHADWVGEPDFDAATLPLLQPPIS